MRTRWLGCLLLLAACGDGTDDLGTGQSPIGAQPTVDSGVSAPPVTTTTPVGPSGGPNSAATPDPGPVATAPVGNGLPCDVDKILKDKCQTCHSNPPTGAAPVPLVTLADLQVDSKIVTGQKMSARVKARINDTKLPMPPTGRTPLTAAEKTALEAYIDGGTKPNTVACAAPVASTTPVKTGLGDWQPPDSDCEVMMEMRAHGGQTEGDTTAFTAPTGGDSYEIFWFKPTWNEKMHVIRIDPIIDNKAVLHHWLLYMKPNGTERVGSHNPDSGLQSGDSALLSGWAPGNLSIPLGTEVGLQVVQGAQARFGIEIHYNTGANPPSRADRSGARLCLTKKLRKHEAGTHWLGTQAILGEQAVGTCSVPMESHIIAHSPHMHKLGKYMKTIVTRRGGGTTTITDKPFAFDDQQIFPVDDPSGEIVVKQGDVITTTCDYTGFANFGTGTADEMCYNFVVAYPVGSLQSVSLLTVGGTKTTCIDGF